MLATRSILKAVAQNPTSRNIVFKNVAAAPMGVRHFNASRVSQAQSPDAETEILRQQRKLRPVSPHLPFINLKSLGIYQVLVELLVLVLVVFFI
ncbi:unnamed protein product [Cunninghamella echinulata]